MKAFQFSFNIVRWAYTRAAGMVNPKEFYGPRSCVSLNDVPEPELRGPHWVKIRSILSGFCGSDLGAIMLHDSPTVQPFASFPFTLGHENYGLVEEVGSAVIGLEKGDRVTVKPPLGCRVREIDPPCGPCSRGQESTCENFAEGALAPGTFIGFCADTGGGWSKYFLAHDSQVVKLPDEITDEQAVLIETLSCSLHPLLTAPPDDGDRVLVIGCGVIGLGIIALIRALGIDCHITGIEPVALNAGKAREKGADEVIDPASESVYERTVDITGARLYKPILEKHICMGGYDRIYDCVGSTETINEAFRLAAGGASYVLIGITIPGRVDWTPVWMKSLRLFGNMGYGVDEFRGERMHVFDRVMGLLLEKRVDITDIITHRFVLEEYREAIEVNMNKAKYGAIKTIFDLTPH